MSEPPIILEINKPHFTVELSENMLKIDLKGSIRNDIEEALENKAILRETIGGILSIFVPLHIRLSDIDSIHMDETGKVKINLHLHRSITIPVELEDAKRLVSKLNQLIPKAKEKELERIMKEQRLRKVAEEEEEMERVPLVTSAAQMPIPEPSGVLEKEREAEKRMIREEEEKEEEED